MNALGKNIVSAIELKKWLSELKKSNFNASLAIAFCDIDFDIQSVTKIFNNNNIDLIGCTTAGEICNGAINSKSMSVLLLDINRNFFEVFYLKGDGTNYEHPAKQLAQYAQGKFDNPAFLVYSGAFGIDGESIINSITNQYNKVIPLYGGQAGDNMKFDNPIVFTNKGIFKNGIASVIFNNDKVDLNGKTYSGWQELGIVHTVTKSAGNILYEIDNKPALDLFNSYFKNIEYERSSDSDDIYTIPGIHPLKILKSNNSEVLRSPLMFDFENKALILGGAVKVGDKFKFCPSPNFETVEETLNQYKKLGKETDNAEAVIMHSCTGRHFAFGPMFEDEIQGLHEIWDVPSIGFMSYGEFGNPNNKTVSEYHNVTCALVTINEK